MRVLFTGPYLPARDGIGEYTAALVRSMAAQGHEARVVAARELPGAPPEVLGAVPHAPWALDGLLQLVDAFEPDVVHVQFAAAAFTTRVPALLVYMRALRARPAPVVVTLHEVLRDTGLTGAPGRALYRSLAGLADRVIVHTHAARTALADEVGGRVDHCVVLPFPQAGLRQTAGHGPQLRVRHGLGAAPILLAFGFIHVDKGLGDLVRALQHAHHTSPEVAGGVELVVAGAVRGRHGVFKPFEWADRLHLAAVRREIGRSVLAGRVHFTGYVPGAEVRSWFEIADAVVLPYRRIDQSMVSSVAAATRTPVLLSRVGGLAEGAPDRWTFPPRDPRAMARVITDFLAAHAAGETPDTGAPSPTLEAFTESTLDVYEDVRGAVPAGVTG